MRDGIIFSDLYLVIDDDGTLIKLLDLPISIKTTPNTAVIESKEDCEKLTLKDAQS